MSKPIYLFSISSHPHAKSINSLDVTLLKPEIDFSQYDFFVLTSKQASEALKQYDAKAYIHIPALCVSTQSALAYESLGGKVLACGNGYGDNLTETIAEFPHAKKWLYLRAKVVASDFISTCQDEGYSVDEVVVYESVCSKELWHVEVEEDAVLIFTSPSSVECFLKNHTIVPSNKVIVIGATTASSLPKETNYILSAETTIQSCMDIALKL